MNDHNPRYSNDLAGRASLCRDVIRSAGALVLSGFKESSERGFSLKGPQDFLTETDAASEAHIRQAITTHFPGDAFLGEEGGGSIGDRVWVVDPVDGTANFARGIPHFCISITYVEGGSAEIGAIYNPAQDELYFCRRGAGATLNGKPISISSTVTFDAASVEMGWSRRVPDETYLQTMRLMLAKGANVRRGASGALALAYVADGRSDAYVELHMNSWDCLAGLLLVAEAGGVVCPFLEIGSLRDGGPVLASTPAIADGVSEASGIPILAHERTAALQPA
ncbi:inositol monophosphatase [Ensifer adhaerens]|uniref:inositol monophosphatase family protein n=1 Tax=Ensifer adhaerens TaxID=106592 RepID=UPI001CBBDFC2|nr:inositol monophosphatase [Ensifer adhaerens]MBZ7925945.1 inositol monophosphatase [Ensifer adhaerens]UAX94901.1 inositol monophosphatase [Ensifer adhaerens]UAY03208.1 inositol monophosphatase [Ensifer adhaerens]UAY11193.1 inositol monophosphatase [Ensifer adhaerens]